MVAHRMRTAAELEDAGEEAAKARELAKQALIKADAATTAGNADEAARWTQAAQTIAMKIQASDSNVATLRAQLTSAETQAEQAKQAVNQNAMRLQEMTAKRIELLGKLESARMQENVNKAMEQLTATVGDEAPTLAEVEDKIQARVAQASANAELHVRHARGRHGRAGARREPVRGRLDAGRAAGRAGPAEAHGGHARGDARPRPPASSHQLARGGARVAARHRAGRDARGAGRGAQAAAVELTSVARWRRPGVSAGVVRRL